MKKHYYFDAPLFVFRGHSSCAPVRVLPVSVARCPTPPHRLKPHPSRCHNILLVEKKKRKRLRTHRCANENNRVFPISNPSDNSMTVSAIYSTQHYRHETCQTVSDLQSPSCPTVCVYVCVRACVRARMRVCACMLVTPEYAVGVSAEDSRLTEMWSVPARGRSLAGSGRCSAGNSTPVFWQTQAPPVL